MKHQDSPHVCRFMDYTVPIEIVGKDLICEELDGLLANHEFSVNKHREYIWKFSDCRYRNVWFPLERLSICDEEKVRGFVYETSH